jgi:hypothetical protein
MALKRLFAFLLAFEVCGSVSVLTFNSRLFDEDLYYAAESRIYPKDSETLFVTCRYSCCTSAMKSFHNPTIFFLFDI